MPSKPTRSTLSFRNSEYCASFGPHSHSGSIDYDILTWTISSSSHFVFDLLSFSYLLVPLFIAVRIFCSDHESEGRQSVVNQQHTASCREKSISSLNNLYFRFSTSTNNTACPRINTRADIKFGTVYRAGIIIICLSVSSILFVTANSGHVQEVHDILKNGVLLLNWFPPWSCYTWMQWHYK